MAEQVSAVRIQIKGADELNKLQQQVTTLSSRQRELNKQIRNVDTSTAKGRQEFNRLNGDLANTRLNLKAARTRFNEVQKGILQTNGVLRRSGGLFRGLSGSLIKAGAALGLAFGGVRLLTRGISAGIDTFREFEKASSDLAAVMGTTTNGISELTDQAKQLGSTTAFTASQVISLQKELAKLGFTQNEILDASEAILNLAAATGSDLAQAASVAGATIRGFDLDADETTRVVDVMTKSFSRSALDINKFQTAMAIVAPVTSQAGVSVEETTALLGVLSDRGVDASTAATALRNIFLDSAKAGISVNEALNRINNSTDKTGTALELFGKRGAAVATILATNQDAVSNLNVELQNAQGTAQEMADTQLDNLDGSITKLSSAWEGFILSIEDGNSVLNQTLRTIVDVTTSLVGFLTTLNSTRNELDDQEDSLREFQKSLDGLTLEQLNESLKIAEKRGGELREEIQQLDDGTDENKETVQELEAELSMLTEQYFIVKDAIRLFGIEQEDAKEKTEATTEAIEKQRKAQEKAQKLQEKAFEEAIKAFERDTDARIKLAELIAQTEQEKIDAINQRLEFELANEALTLNQKKLLEQQAEQDINDIRRQGFEERQEIINQQKEAELELRDAKIFAAQSALQAIQQLAGEESGIAKTAFLLQKGIAIGDVLIRLQQELAAIKLAGELQAAAVALIPGAPAIVAAATAGKLLAAKLRSAGSIATIAATAITGFVDGGFTGKGKNNEIAGPVHKNEYVIPAKVLNRPQGMAIARRAEQMRKQGFQDGGFTSPIPNIAGIQQESANIEQLTQNIATQIGSLKVINVESETREIGRRVQNIESEAKFITP